MASYTYFGNTELSLTILVGLRKIGREPFLVVTTKPKPAGRGLKLQPSPVAQYCRKNNLPYIEVDSLKNDDTLSQLKENKTPYAILAAFGKILPQSVLGLYPQGIINVHPSLLPKWRGPSPLQYALMSGETTAGVSLILLDSEVDHGPILSQKELRIQPADSYTDLENKAAALAVSMLNESVDSYLSGNLLPEAQNHNQATFTKMIAKESGKVDFNKTADELNNIRRALSVWPGLWTLWQSQVLKLIDTEVSDLALPLGQVSELNGNIAIGTSKGSLVLKQIQLAGKKPASAMDFVRGHQDFIGSILGK